MDVFIDREKENIIIVDNSIMSFAFDLDNGVPIQSFMGDETDDKELLFLISFLEEAIYTQDVRPSIREAFKLSVLKDSIVTTDGSKWSINNVYVQKVNNNLYISHFKLCFSFFISASILDYSDSTLNCVSP